MTRIEVYTGIGKSIPAQIVFQDTRHLIKWGMAFVDELLKRNRWGEIWLSNGGGNRNLVVSARDFPQFISGFRDRCRFRDTDDSEFYLGKIKTLREAIDGKVVIDNEKR